MKIRQKEILKSLMLILMFSSCKTLSTYNGNIFGKYHYHGIYGVASNITLEENNSFVFNWQTGLIFGTTKGTWLLEDNNIILNSEKQPVEEIVYNIIEREKTDKAHYEITVLDFEYKIPLMHVECNVLNDSLIEHAQYHGKYLTDGIGDCILPFNKNGRELLFSYIGYNTVRIPINQINSNSFILELKEEEGYFRFFTNEKWRVKKGRIYNPELKKNKYARKNYYEKI